MSDEPAEDAPPDPDADGASSDADEDPPSDADEAPSSDAGADASTAPTGAGGSGEQRSADSTAPADPGPDDGRNDDPDDRDDELPDGPSGGEESGGESSEEVATHAPVGGVVPDESRIPDDRADDVAASDGGTLGGGGGVVSTPPGDEEMPLTEHIEEMLWRLAVVVVVASLATLAAFPFADDVIIRMWYDVHPGVAQACHTAPQTEGCVPPHVYGPLELVLTRIRVAGLAGLLVALPLAVYQVYLFMRPGLYSHERRYYLAAVPFSLVLGIVGMVFAYFVLLPLLFTSFVTYTEGSAELAFQLADTMNLILIMMGMLAIVFQIPLLIMLAILMGITTRQWLERRRIYFWGLFLGIAFLFGPDPTGMAPVLLTATMVVLFEATLLLLRWTGR